jgi:hypothetical protein
MPRRVADYPDAFAGWNYVSSIGSYISAPAWSCFSSALRMPSPEGARRLPTRGASAQRPQNGHCLHRRHSTNTKLCRGSNSSPSSPAYDSSRAQDLPIRLQSLQAELAMEREGEDRMASSAVMPALAHSSSCSGVGAPLTPQPPRTMFTSTTGRPPRWPTGATTLLYEDNRKPPLPNFSNSRSLGSPVIAAATALPMEQRSFCHPTEPSIWFSTISRPLVSHTATLTLIPRC